MQNKLAFTLVVLSFLGPAAIADYRMACVGRDLLYVESSPSSGLPIPHKSGAVFFEDKLVERASNIVNKTEEIQWKKASVYREVLETLAMQVTSDKRVVVTSEKLSLRSTGIDASETVICMESKFFKPVP